MGETVTLRAARAYAARGLTVFPCNAKIPATTNGCDDASSDPDQLAAWFGNERNIAIVTPPGIVVVDVDPRNRGDKTLDGWCQVHGHQWLDGVPKARTGGGGHHYWFRYDGTPLVKSIGGIDFQRGNKYVIAPPSITAAQYEWEIRLPTTLTDLPELPAWLYELARKPEAPPLPDRTYQSDDPIDDAAHKMTTFPALLTRHGWTLVSGDGLSDGSKWRHPTSENQFSATMRHGCLFVYSPTPGLPVTEDGDPHGLTLFRALELLDYHDNRAQLVQALRDSGYLAPLLPVADPGDLVAPSPNGNGAAPAEIVVEPELQLSYIDWPHAFAADDDVENRWLVEPIIALGRAHALYAGAKTGKSLLMLALAAALASGRPFLGLPEHPPTPVLYLDYEMTQDDVIERLEAFDYTPADLTRLHYGLLSSSNGLDSPAGAAPIVSDATTLGVSLVIVDTLGRAVVGAENDADTLRAFYRCTGSPLKRLGIAVARLDHQGKDATLGQRGSSAKNDDVDIVWKLSARDAGAYDLEATHQRMGWVEKKVGLKLDENEKTGKISWALRSGPSFAPRAKETAELLDAYGAPPDCTFDRAAELLRGNGWTGRNDLISQGLKWRKQAVDKYLFTGDEGRGAPRGAPTPETASGSVGE